VRVVAAAGSVFLGFLALFLSIWIVIPGPTPSLFVLTVGSTELWPIVALIDGSICAVVFRCSAGPVRTASLALALLALLLTAVPPIAYVIRGPAVPLRVFLGAADGTTVSVAAHVLRNGDIMYAPATREHALPIVIAIYGGAWQRGSPRSDRLLNERIASWGYVVVAIDYPHAPRARWPSQREAVLRALDWVRAHAAALDGDPSRIVLLGHSSGAQLALIVASMREGAVRAVVTYESPVDLELGYLHPSRPDIIHIQAILRNLCGAPPQLAMRCYRSASPLDVVRPGMPPVLMFAAGRDHVADLGYERILRDRLRHLGVAVTYVELAWADHAFETVAYGFHNRIAMWYLHGFLSRMSSR